jgi:hypothetical protein
MSLASNMIIKAETERHEGETIAKSKIEQVTSKSVYLLVEDFELEADF